MASTTNRWRIVQGAASVTRDEVISLGVTTSNQVRAQMTTGSEWNEVAFSPLATVAESEWWGFDVEYETQSGDALMVWNNGNQGISYRTWDGSTWSTEQQLTVLLGSGEPRQMHLAVNPTSGEMVLIANQDSGTDYAVVWDGSGWGNAQILTSVSDSGTDISVTYEQQSGRAMVVYGASSDLVFYRTWDGSNWSSEGSLAPPASVANVGWTTLGADPSSNRIVVGVNSNYLTDSIVWAAVWDGTAWDASVYLSKVFSSSFLGIAVAFEGSSGEALVAYSFVDNVVRYRTWNGSWSGQLSGPDLGHAPNSLTLAGDSRSNQIMLSVQDSDQDANFVLWDGTSWGVVNQLGTATGETLNQPILFVWR